MVSFWWGRPASWRRVKLSALSSKSAGCSSCSRCFLGSSTHQIWTANMIWSNLLKACQLKYSFYPKTTWTKTNENQNSIWPETSYCDLLQLTCELICRNLQFLMESLNLNLSHFLFGLYKIIISSVAEKIGYIIELPSHTLSEWQSWVLNPAQHPLGREKRWGEDGRACSQRAKTLVCSLVPLCYDSAACRSPMLLVLHSETWIQESSFGFSLLS